MIVDELFDSVARFNNLLLIHGHYYSNMSRTVEKLYNIQKIVFNHRQILLSICYIGNYRCWKAEYGLFSH